MFQGNMTWIVNRDKEEWVSQRKILTERIQNWQNRLAFIGKVKKEEKCDNYEGKG
jgi:hypothetical protein